MELIVVSSTLCSRKAMREFSPPKPGGKPSRSTALYDQKTKSKTAYAIWNKIHQEGAAPAKRKAHTLCKVLKKAYLFGGNVNNRSCDLWCLDLPRWAWSKMEVPGLHPAKRSYHSAVQYNKKMIVFGGESMDGRGCLNDLWEFDTVGGVWLRWDSHLMGKQPPPRCGHAAVVVDGKMYVYGGCGKEYLDDLWVLDCVSMQWSRIFVDSPNRPGRSAHHTMIAVGQHIVMFGGYHGRQTFQDDAWMFDTLSQQWCKIGPEAGGGGRSPPPLAYHSAVVHNNKMIVYGGNNGYERNQDVWVLDLYEQRWSRLDPPPLAPSAALPNSRESFDVCIYNGEMVVFGGLGDGSTFYNDCWTLSLKNIGEPAPRTKYAQYSEKDIPHVYYKIGMPEPNAPGAQEDVAEEKSHHQQGRTGSPPAHHKAPVSFMVDIDELTKQKVRPASKGAAAPSSEHPSHDRSHSQASDNDLRALIESLVKENRKMAAEFTAKEDSMDRRIRQLESKLGEVMNVKNEMVEEGRRLAECGDRSGANTDAKLQKVMARIDKVEASLVKYSSMVANSTKPAPTPAAPTRPAPAVVDETDDTRGGALELTDDNEEHNLDEMKRRLKQLSRDVMGSNEEEKEDSDWQVRRGGGRSGHGGVPNSVLTSDRALTSKVGALVDELANLQAIVQADKKERENADAKLASWKKKLNSKVKEIESCILMQKETVEGLEGVIKSEIHSRITGEKKIQVAMENATTRALKKLRDEGKDFTFSPHSKVEAGAYSG